MPLPRTWAMCDDDGWYERDGLVTAADVLDDHPDLASVNARILVGPEERLDPISAEMADSPAPSPEDLPGSAPLGFMAGAVIVRRSAYLVFTLVDRPKNRDWLRGLATAVRGLPWVLRERAPMERGLDEQLRLLDRRRYVERRPMLTRRDPEDARTGWCHGCDGSTSVTLFGMDSAGDL